MKSGDKAITWIAAIILVNGLITALHYVPILTGMMRVATPLETVAYYAVTDAISILIPSILAAIGLWMRRGWGLVLAVITAGAYLHGILLLIVDSVNRSSYNFMNIISLYFIVFSAWSVVYLWRRRAQFD